MSGMDWIVLAVIFGILALAVGKLVSDKKKGAKCASCTGCPVQNSCSSESIQQTDPFFDTMIGEL